MYNNNVIPFILTGEPLCENLPYVWDLLIMMNAILSHLLLSHDLTLVEFDIHPTSYDL